jgi:alkylated DNA repair dioxygenase AlkB
MPTETELAWLVAEPTVERIDLDATSWVDVVRGIVRDPEPVYATLLADVPWQPSRVFRYEKWIDEPRLGSFQSGDGRHPALVAVQTWITRRYRATFDGVALVQYRDERDSVGWHRDRELRWLDDTVIGVLTLGQHRPWLMRPITGDRYRLDDDLADAVDLSPASGDLLVMGGRAQADWLHAVPKVHGRVAPRISAQWRWTSRRGRRDTQPGFYAPRHFGR